MASQRRVAFLPGVSVTLKHLRNNAFVECLKTLGEHLKRRRREPGLIQREVAERMDIDVFTYLNWETDKTKPLDAQFGPVVRFLGYDPSRPPITLSVWRPNSGP